MAQQRHRPWFLAAAVGGSILWLGCWAATVVPGSSAVTMQWALGNLLAALTGAAIGVAVVCRSRS
ncbi:hypothetical protein AB1L88_12930 [Tautonia sp. JC769]|uniref:hypothetical protein n=1 Tax=Tautonia sp. JC769 TaxID=3232135 RepID=UPI003459FA22